MRKLLVPSALLIAILVSVARGQSWWARPLVVHEWGVEAFDWSAGQGPAARASDIPAYMYTDTRPGVAAAMPAKRVKDLPRDSGQRMKPILYFYWQDGFPTIPIGVEMRFAEGDASAWYPQVNVYRSPAQAAAAKPLAHAPVSGAGVQVGGPNIAPAPDDTRMQLVWYGLRLSKDLPADEKLAGSDLPADHWAKRARLADAAYVSNGKEAEKYLFYEGQTREHPAVAVVPTPFEGFSASSAAQHIVNISDRPIYDVFAIYHSGGNTWVGFVSALEPMASVAGTASGGVTVATLPLPDFTKAVPWTDPQSLHDATTGRLLSALTEGGTLVAKANIYRNPADPQGPTASGQLFPDEAAALEKIWHHDFFEGGADGTLTILYRQSPAALDADMPLNIYTDMYHYIDLLRCGMVMISNIDPKLVRETYMNVQLGMLRGDEPAASDAVTFLRAHVGLAHSALNYFQRTSDSPECRSLRQKIDAP